MVQPQVQQFIPLVVISIIGIGFTFFGYDLADQLLKWIGWVGGAAAGVAVGWLAVPYFVYELPVQQHLAWTGGLLVVGAIAGRILLPLFTRLAVMVAGFVTSAAALLVLFAGPQITYALTLFDPQAVMQGRVNMLVTQLMELPLFQQQQQILLIALGGGLVGAIVSSKFYHVLVSLVATGIGAVIIGFVGPLWLRVSQHGVPTGIGAEIDMISYGWVVVAFGLGAVVQGYRHEDQLPFDIPTSLSEV